MNKLCLFTVLVLTAVASAHADRKTVSVKKYSITAGTDVEFGDLSPYSPGICSGLSYVKAEGDTVKLVSVTDRGPNFKEYREDGTYKRVFPRPFFSPLILHIDLTYDSAEITRAVKIRNSDGKFATGLPWPPSQDSKQEFPVTSEGLALAYDPFGMDTEGISVIDDNLAWVADEYGPSLMLLDYNNGKVLERLSPRDVLPGELLSRTKNRGLEGVAAISNDVVVSSNQSVIPVGGGKYEGFIRFVRYDRKSGKSTQHRYPIKADKYKDAEDIKIGGLHSAGKNRLIVIEHGFSKKDRLKASIYLADLSAEVIEKKKLINIAKHGWKHKKAEGLAILEDQKTILVCNDNDFDIEKADGMTSAENGKININTDLWVFKLEDKI